MSARELEQYLNTAPMSNPRPRDVRCANDRGGWDYYCTYVTNAPHPGRRLKIGVMVDANRIVRASAPHGSYEPLPQP